MSSNAASPPTTEGREVASLASAYDLAITAARAVMCAELDEGRLCLACHIDVIGAAGERLLHVPFSDAVTITGG
uniref:DUF6894 family protein n=1 Tax=uncultured Sphingomonas sp. TaxID=158754 RepID=UPI0035CBF07E